MSTPENKGKQGARSAIPDFSNAVETMSSKVKAVLYTEFPINGTARNFWISIGNKYHDKNTDQPNTATIVALQGALDKHRLSQDEQVRLFTYLEWKFACHSCKIFREADKYKTAPFIYWGDTYPAVVSLRSGPCEKCEEKNKRRDTNDQVLGISYKFIDPSWRPPTFTLGSFFDALFRKFFGYTL